MTKHMNECRIAALLLTTVLVAACDKNAVQVLPADSLLASRIKFFNFSVNAPGVNFYSDAIKMTAIQSGTGSEATTGVGYGSVGNGGAYSQIAPGSHTLTGRIAATTDKDLSIATVTTFRSVGSRGRPSPGSLRSRRGPIARRAGRRRR